MVKYIYGSLTQLARVSPLHGGSRGFESLATHQIILLPGDYFLVIFGLFFWHFFELSSDFFRFLKPPLFLFSCNFQDMMIMHVTRFVIPNLKLSTTFNF